MSYCCATENGVQEKYVGDWAEGRMHGRGSYWYVRSFLLFFIFIFDIIFFCFECENKVERKMFSHSYI